MKSWAFVTTPYAWCVPRSRSLVTTNSVWSTQILVSGRAPRRLVVYSRGGGGSTPPPSAPRVRRPERLPENRRTEIVPGGAVPAEERSHGPLLDEPDHASARSRVSQGGPPHPDDLPAA